MHPIIPIGTIHSPHTSIENMPIQPKGATEFRGTVVLEEQYTDGLQDLAGFSHIYLIYSFHKATRTELLVTPFLDQFTRGVFATRSPLRPNHIGLSIVQLESIDGNTLYIKGVDILDGTPLLDIKPYVEKFDAVRNSRSGWMQASEDEVRKKRSDSRFG
ncbi:MAG: tRNA (N6-threonylcarbamoyladenosine(37)-N6)-methyltransferase TrmO [Desulfobulbus sp.]|nr:tRNA (N6-threonylcarbamoyladenosine(37)-N6)-methyltransferase TrmO [Desulfobulbus sp.]